MACTRSFPRYVIRATAIVLLKIFALGFRIVFLLGIRSQTNRWQLAYLVVNCFSFAEPRGLHPFFPKVCYSCYGHCFTESFCFRFQNCIFTWHSQLSKICWILSGGCELLSELYFYLAFAVLEVQIIENLQL